MSAAVAAGSVEDSAANGTEPACTPSPIDGYVCVMDLDGSGVQMHWSISDVNAAGEDAAAAAESVASEEGAATLRNASFLAVAPVESNGGWVALGFGTSMIGARAAIAYQQSGALGGLSAGIFALSGYSADSVQEIGDADAEALGFLPDTLAASVTPFASSAALPINGAAADDASSGNSTTTEPALSVSFSRILSAAEERLAAMVFATGSSWKDYHGAARGTFEANLQSGESQTLDVQSPLRDYWIAHGALMLSAWLFIAPASASAVRLLRPACEKGRWFNWVHFPGGLLMMCLTLAGFVIAAVKFDAGGINSAEYSHGAIGVTVFALVCAQVLLGLGRPRDKESKTRWYWYALHAGLGCSALGLGLSNAVIGVNVICDLDRDSCDSWIISASVVGAAGVVGVPLAWWLIARSVLKRRATEDDGPGTRA